MSSSTEWSDAQLRLLINERKQRNSERQKDIGKNYPSINNITRVLEEKVGRAHLQNLQQLPLPKQRQVNKHPPPQNNQRSPGESSSPKVVKNSKETPTLPSFSQNANVIDVTINNNYAGAPEEED
ncbi:hypothetical protein RhiirC2_795312 [Rhizophagus irregularis]|uniref:Uncharacterized protein n=1 Tax=Rhizophagus irregularis TaxID=588596 RepID=A0A2N1MBV8_9GLOM|nr:hypothetical protein RhiirC2_795312 [Rhizophagus irregularis]